MKCVARGQGHTPRHLDLPQRCRRRDELGARAYLLKTQLYKELRVEERERTRIARDLRDTLLQSLAGVALQLDQFGAN